MPPPLDIAPLDAAAILVVLAAVLGFLNARYLRLPSSVGMTAMAALASLIVIGVDRLIPGSKLGPTVVSFISGIDFRATLMDGMLSFLLFAGALHVNWRDMQKGRWPILALSTVGVILSTVLIGGGFYGVTLMLGFKVPFIWSLVFGALISPTDPVAVMAALRHINVASTLKATVAGESLFNDGVGVVVFSILLAVAVGSEPFSLGHALQQFLFEAGGGALLGFAAGWLAFRAIRSIDDYNVEVMLSLALVMGGYALAGVLHVSGSVAMAVAGLLIGNHGVAQAMSETTRDYLLKFWTLIDEILNAVLFLLIGLAVVTVPFDPRLLLAAAIAVPLTLFARAISVLLPLAAMKPLLSLGRLAPATLIWGGFRGSISVALALSLPDSPYRLAVFTATYVVVLFSVIIQGGTIVGLLSRLTSKAPRILQI